ncbi:hypothetical protein [Streptomyces sp. 769]|uniref:hypothetical protein n=1 Tax=Streptomyces sp. 769 TaxID=1262452 RepID=UPI00131AD331|nr:hypothetical protein [Streptomyces sp. 769]
MHSPPNTTTSPWTGAASRSPPLFCDHAVTLVDLDLPPRIWYPARGLATVWHTQTSAPRTDLADLLGRTSAHILTQLAEPASTTDLAHRLALSGGRPALRSSRGRRRERLAVPPRFAVCGASRHRANPPGPRAEPTLAK